LNSFSFQNKVLHAESVSVTDLMAEYGSPLYIYSRSQIEFNWQQFENSFDSHPHLICYAVKANSNLAVLNILAKLGSGFDVVSIGELERVIAAGGNQIVAYSLELLKQRSQFKKHLNMVFIVLM